MELYVIGDLHLGDGSHGDDFRADDERALVSFLFRLSRVPDAVLVVNGDFIDFAQIQPQSRMWYDDLMGASEEDSLAKLERALVAHSPVFDALGRFVAAGGRLRCVLGDRDADLVWPRVQARLRERIGTLSGRDALGFGTSLQRDGIHIEHGHRCDPVAAFTDAEQWVLLGPGDVPRLERTLSTRVAEEFYAPLDRLSGWEMLDNVLPRISAAMLVLRHALPDRSMHAALLPLVRTLLDSLTLVRGEDELGDAATRLGINRQLLGWLASVAGWLSTAAADEDEPLRPPEVPSLRRAFAYGASLEDGAKLAQFAPPALPGTPQPLANTPRPADRRAAARRLYDENPGLLDYVATIAAQHEDLRAVCLGHTERAIDTRLRFDDEPGWPVPGAAARYYNSGGWGRVLHLDELPPEQRSVPFIASAANHRVLRDYLRVAWPEPGELSVETLAWC